MNSPTTDFEEWLDSLGLNASFPETNTQAEQSAIANGDLPPEPLNSEIQPVSFSEEDVDSLLEENGFAGTQYDEAEEIEEEENEEEEDDNTEEYNENGGEGRDLDAEEDADWQEIIESRHIVPANVEEATVPPTSVEGSNTPLIPENSPTLSLDESTSRFSGTEWYDEMITKSIMIAGCGGIGSWLALLIARLKPYSITLYDSDKVELANMSGQLFAGSDVGKYKVEAVHNKIYEFTNACNINAFRHNFITSTIGTDIMMCGFDNMEARKIYYTAWKNRLSNMYQSRRKNCLFMDGRLTIDVFQVLCLTGDDICNMERYEREFLFDDSQAEAEVCSQKQTTYLACMIGSIMTNLFINWVASSLDPVIPYKVPFFTQYEAQHMIFKTEE